MNNLSIPSYQPAINAIKVKNTKPFLVQPTNKQDSDNLHFSGSSKLFNSACEKGDISFLKLMLNRGHDPNDYILWSSSMDRAIHHTVRAGQDPVLDFLLSLPGLYIDVNGNDNMTPLMIACQKGNHNTVKKLIARGAQTSHLRNSDKLSAFDLAAEKNHLNIVQELLNYKPKLLGNHGQSAFIAACNNDAREVMTFLLNKGIKPDFIKVGLDEDPLITAYAKVGNLKAVEFLLQKGVNPNRTNKWGEKAVDVAGNDEIKVLIQKHERLKSVATSNPFSSATISGDMQLHNALKSGNKDTAKRLILQGKGLNTQDANGNTPLHIVASKGDEELAMLLVAKNADATLVNHEAKDAAQLALKEGHMNIFEVIMGK